MACGESNEMLRRWASKTKRVQTMKREAEEEHRLVLVFGEESAIRSHLGRKIAGGSRCHGINGFGGEIAHAANGRAPRRHTVSGGRRVRCVEHQIWPPLLALNVL